MSKSNHEKPVKTNLGVVKLNIDKIKGGNIGSHPPPKPDKPTKGN